ncbi:electron transfer flavoprotein subunit alpha/FixB family protein [Stygiolobus caldivivus]|uniref:Electron transfer flavoprotein subunit alpha n=1 Tax=Stygiolobus caldivivus TaxID=2824673 RepID=A0A8D5U7C0_9CREN|nr:electron transfer flavoprotein subunit alpha/FixB family protein [Stygiolobus caldivivus]BCU70327.1 electron transfer flavoprotein subunit alpha [Stygiolobus caldivivus]
MSSTVVIYSEDVDYIKTGIASTKGKTIVISPREVRLGDENHVINEIDEQLIAEYIARLKPDLVLTGSSKRDKTVAGLTAGLLRVPIIPDVIELSENKAKRVVYSGMAIAELEFSYPIVITLVKKNTDIRENPDCKIIKADLSGNSKVKVVEEKHKEGGSIDLSSAQIIVSVGRGVGSKENVKYAEELANALGGAVGGSRPVTAELGWLPEDRQIGLSGTKVKPKLYIALGISGQPQHLAGIKDSKIIVAVNKDKNAPIVENADYTIIGDVIEFCKVFAQKVKGI